MKTFAEEQQYLRKKFYYDKEHAHGLIEFYNEMTNLIEKQKRKELVGDTPTPPTCKESSLPF